MTEADFRKVATPGERAMRSTVDIQRASSVTVNKYVCAYIYIGMHTCMHAYIYVYVHVYRCVCVYIWMGVRRKGGTKLYGKMNGGYKKVRQIILQIFLYFENKVYA